jgi:hypothetical protein
MQVVAVARMVTRLVVGIPWAFELGPDYTHSLLCAAVRQVFPDFASELSDADQDLIEEYGRRIRRAIGRKQKRALGIALERLIPAPGRADVANVLLAAQRAEVRVAFVLTGDLLTTIDDVRAGDPELARASEAPGIGALAATLKHPLAGDVARFGLGGPATALRWRAGTLWGATGATSTAGRAGAAR